jgi:hypothetical protein
VWDKPEEFNWGPPHGHEKNRMESDYWSAIFSEEEIPADCAGFLHYIPQSDNVDQKKKLFDYIFFPYRPGTDWEKAFNCFLDYVGNLPYVKVNDIKLPLGISLLIDKKCNIFVMDNDEKIAEVKMPVLSKVLYFTFLQHPEGFSIKNLVDYKSELLDWYRKMSNRKDMDKSIDDLIDPTKNSANEKISRIRYVLGIWKRGSADRLITAEISLILAHFHTTDLTEHLAHKEIAWNIVYILDNVGVKMTYPALGRKLTCVEDGEGHIIVLCVPCDLLIHLSLQGVCLFAANDKEVSASLKYLIKILGNTVCVHFMFPVMNAAKHFCGVKLILSFHIFPFPLDRTILY